MQDSGGRRTAVIIGAAKNRGRFMRGTLRAYPCIAMTEFRNMTPDV